MAKSAYVSFRAGDLEAELEKRDRDDSLGLVAKRDLERYYTLLQKELATVNLTPAEAVVLCGMLGGEKITGPRFKTLLWATVLEGLPLNLTILSTSMSVEDIDATQAQLVKTLRHCSHGQAMALIDAVERFRKLPDATLIATDAVGPSPVEALETLAQIGLIREYWVIKAKGIFEPDKEENEAGHPETPRQDQSTNTPRDLPSEETIHRRLDALLTLKSTKDVGWPTSRRPGRGPKPPIELPNDMGQHAEGGLDRGTEES